MRTGKVFMQVTNIALLVIVVAGFAGPAAADDNFCRGLKAIVADAPNDFSSFLGNFRGTEKQTLPDLGDGEGDLTTVINHYAASGWPEGASFCEIIAERFDSPGAKYSRAYQCQFPIYGDDKGAATRELTLRAGNCLGIVGTAEMVINVDRNGGMYHFNSNDKTIEYQLSANSSSSTITFMIQYDGHQ
jgi:hypothetical protein